MASKTAAIGMEAQGARLAVRRKSLARSASTVEPSSPSLERAVRLLETLAEAANQGTPAEAMQRSLAAICEHSGWAAGRLVLVTESEVGAGAATALWHIHRPGSPERPIAEWETEPPCAHDSFLRRMLDDPRAMWVPDSRSIPAHSRFLRVLNDGPGCIFAFPVIVGGAVEAVVEFFADEPRAIDVSMMAVITSIGAQFARLVERHDISTLREAKQRLHRASRAHRVLAECSHALVRATEELQLLEQMCRIVVDSGGYRQGWIGLATDNANIPVQPVAYAGYGDDAPMTSRVNWSREGSYLGLAGEAVKRGEIRIARNILEDPAHSRKRTRAVQLGYQSSIALPLKSADGISGVLVLHAAEAQAFDDDELALLSDLADDIGFGISNLRVRVKHREAEAQRRAGERRLRETFEQAAVGIMRVDLEGMLVDVNQKLCDLLGYAKDELLGKSVREITHPDDYGAGSQFRQGIRSGATGTLSGEKRYLRKDGSALWARRTMSVASDDTGNPHQLISIVEDITHSKELERRFELTFDHAPLGMALIGMDGNYLRVNRRWCGMLGYGESELIGRSPDDITHPDDIEASRRHSALLAEGKAARQSGEKRYIHKDGRVVWVRRTESMACDELGKPMYAIRVIEDITETKEAAERYRATFDSAPVGIMHTAADAGKLLHANPKLCEMLGYSHEELLRLRLSDIVHSECRDEETDCRRRMLDGEMATYSSECKLVRKDGSSVWANRTIALVRSASGEPQYFIRVVEDISERKQALETIARERALLRAVVDAVPERIYVKDHEGRLLLQNTANVQAHGARSYEELLGKTVFDLFPPETARRIDAEDRSVMASGRPLLDRERATTYAGGEVRWIASSKVPLADASGAIMGIVGVNRDITERKRMERELTVSEQTLRATFTHARVGITVISLDLRYVEVNQQYCDIVGYSREELMDRMKLTAVCGPESLTETEEACRRMLAGEAESDSREQRLMRRNGSTVWVVSAISLVRDTDGNAKHFVSVTQDISESKVAEERLLQLAHYDTLTGLPNRSLFNQKVRESLSQARNWRTGVMFIDVDRFKTVNDTLGHMEGDKLLKQISERLTRAVRRGDTVGRLGGDEFAVVLTNLASGHDAGIVAQKIITSFLDPFPLAGSEIYVSASVGIALHPDHAPDQDTLIKNADAAMYEAKKRGRNGYQFYTPELNARSVELLTFENDLRRALEREEFVVHYQPKSCIATGEITGFEALLRWEHPGQGLVSPRDFIPLLEETGLIVPAGEWVLDHVCMQLARWQEEEALVVPVSINISARQFNSAHLAENFRRIMEKRGTAPALIELELTESALMVNTQEATRMLEELKGLGLSLSIDDFGTGYSSLAYLKGFPLDTLKIDRSFVKDIAEDHDDRAITLAIISMAHSLGLSVVAEGVETPGQMQFLRQHGCDQMQGHYLAQPMSAGACAAWLRARKQI